MIDCVKVGEVLVAKFASPLYTEVTECDCAASVAVVNDAVLLESETVPSVAVPSLKVIVPVGVPEVEG